MGLKNDLFIINLIELANHFVFKFSSFSKLASDGFLHIHGNRAANSWYSILWIVFIYTNMGWKQKV